MVNYSAKALNRASAARADYYPRLGLPFAIFGDPAVETYVLSRGQLQPEYYISIVGVYTAAALEQKLRDARLRLTFSAQSVRRSSGQVTKMVFLFGELALPGRTARPLH